MAALSAESDIDRAAIANHVTECIDSLGQANTQILTERKELVLAAVTPPLRGTGHLFPEAVGDQAHPGLFRGGSASAALSAAHPGPIGEHQSDSTLLVLSQPEKSLRQTRPQPSWSRPWNRWVRARTTACESSEPDHGPRTTTRSPDSPLALSLGLFHG